MTGMNGKDVSGHAGTAQYVRFRRIDAANVPAAGSLRLCPAENGGRAAELPYHII